MTPRIPKCTDVQVSYVNSMRGHGEHTHPLPYFRSPGDRREMLGKWLLYCTVEGTPRNTCTCSLQLLFICSMAGRSHAFGNHDYEATETSKASFNAGLIDIILFPAILPARTFLQADISLISSLAHGECSVHMGK